VATNPGAHFVQWNRNGDHPHDGPADREGRVVRYFRHPDIPGDQICPACGSRVHDHGWIDSGGDGRTVCPGDWVSDDAQAEVVLSTRTVHA
jgi:hypothetical protein